MATRYAVNLTHIQRDRLRRLVTVGEIWASCTNLTLCALEKRGLVSWETVAGRGFDRWTITPAGRAALEQGND